MKESKTEDSFEDELNRTISDLVYEKTKIIKAYNYYHGVRDPEQFRHLEENYGIGTPTSVEFIPLVRKHIEVLVGEYLSTPILPRVSCKDKETLSYINRDKQNTIINATIKELNSFLEKSIRILGSGIEIQDPDLEGRLNLIQTTLDRNFISEYEIAAQNIVEHTTQAAYIDFANKRKTLLIDLLVAGMCYYKVVPSNSGTSIDLKILNPIDTFIDRNPHSPYLKNSHRSVIRYHMTKQQILADYGKYITKDQLEELETTSEHAYSDYDATYVRSYDNTTGVITDGILGGFEVTPMNSMDSQSSKYLRTIAVYEVEILETRKEDGEFITHKKSGIRIGNSIFIKLPEDENVVRTMSDPNNCTISVNGMFFSDRNGDPFSLILSTANLQD